MSANTATLVPELALFGLAVLLVLASLKAGAMLAPWLLREPVAAPALRRLFSRRRKRDAQLERLRVATAGLAAIVMLASLVALAAAARIAGWSPV